MVHSVRVYLKRKKKLYFYFFYKIRLMYDLLKFIRSKQYLRIFFIVLTRMKGLFFIDCMQPFVLSLF